MTRAFRVTAAAALIVAAAVVPATAAGALGRPCATSPTRVTVVVDRGGGAVSAVCVAAKSSDNGATILATRASTLGLPQPRFNASGLLCAIDGLPADGCGDLHGGKYAYWAYFHGTNGAWSYSNVGPGGSRVSAGVVEGWRFQPAGAGNPTDPPPRLTPSPAACAPKPPPQSPAVAPRVTTAGGTVAPAGAGNDPTTLPGRSPVTTKVTAPGAPSSTRTSPSTRAKSKSTAHASATTTAPLLSERELAARTAARHSDDGAPIGLIVGGVLVALLGTGGVVAARRRNRPAS